MAYRNMETGNMEVKIDQTHWKLILSGLLK